MPRARAKSLAALAASYNLASSPLFLQGHIQLAEREMLVMPSGMGAQTRLVSASAMESTLPAAASTMAATGA
jgi:hypothetical protein